MPICKDAIKRLSEILPDQEVQEVIRLAKKQERIEKRWNSKLDRMYNKIIEKTLDSLEKTGKIPESILDFDDFLFEHSVGVMKQAVKSAKTPRGTKRLAAPPKGKIPRNLRDLMKLWDQWRTKKTVPPRQRDLAKKIKKEYLKKVQSVWRKYSEDFRSGGEDTKKEIAQKIRKAARTTHSRAQMILETETTYYYNQTRKEIYDKSDDITHYLYVAIRDRRTTKWCKTRDHLVFTKDTNLLRRNTPPVHYNCRSELLPLTPFNPAHEKIIDNKSIRAERNRLEPLPKGWNR